MIKGKENITEDEFDDYLVPSCENFNNYMIKYIIPEVFAFQLANAFSRNCLCDASFEVHYNSMCDVFNGFHGCFKAVQDSTIFLLLIKYNLAITSDSPLNFKKWQ